MQETTWSDTRIVVKMLCEERKIPMKRLALFIGVKYRELGKYLDSEPRGDELKKIADAIGVTAEDITEICRLMKLEPAYVAPAGKHQEGE